MRAWGRGPKQNGRLAQLAQLAQSLGLYTDLCGTWSSVMGWGSEDNDEAGELQLWYLERTNKCSLHASNTAGDDVLVCKVIDVFTLHFQKCTDKIKTLLTKKSKFHFVQY